MISRHLGVGFSVLALLAGATPAFSADAAATGFSNESELGVVIAAGNAKSQSYSIRQLNQQRWTSDALRFDGRFLKASADGVESARSWALGLRYERSISDQVSGYAGQNVESDRFAGYRQRYNTDLGGKYTFLQNDEMTVLSEAGYRRTIENREASQVNQNILRVYAEANRNWTKTFSSRLGVEYLPNLTISSDYQLNADLSISAAINEIFALKMGYLLKYRKIPAPPATESADSQFTSALVAKF